jgi:hypothetical protein
MSDLNTPGLGFHGQSITVDGLGADGTLGLLALFQLLGDPTYKHRVRATVSATPTANYIVIEVCTGTPGVFVEALRILGGTTPGVSVRGDIAGAPGAVSLRGTGATPVATRLQFGTDGSGISLAIAKNQAGAVTDFVKFADDKSVEIDTGVKLRGARNFSGGARDITASAVVANNATIAIGDVGSIGLVFITTLDAANNFNVYWDAGTSTYRIENKIGANRQFCIDRAGFFATQ